MPATERLSSNLAVTLSIIEICQPSALIRLVIKQSAHFGSQFTMRCERLSNAIATISPVNNGKAPLFGCLMVINWKMMKNSFLISESLLDQAVSCLGKSLGNRTGSWPY